MNFHFLSHSNVFPTESVLCLKKVGVGWGECVHEAPSHTVASGSLGAGAGLLLGRWGQRGEGRL